MNVDDQWQFALVRGQRMMFYVCTDTRQQLDRYTEFHHDDCMQRILTMFYRRGELYANTQCSCNFYNLAGHVYVQMDERARGCKQPKLPSTSRSVVNRDRYERC